METHRYQPLRKLILGADALLVLAAMPLAAGLHAALRDVAPQLQEPPPFEQYARLVYLALPLFLGLIAALGLHRFLEGGAGRLALVGGLLKLHGAAFLGISVGQFLTQAVVNRSLVGLFLGCTFALLYAERSMLGAWKRWQHDSGQGRMRILLVGDPGGAMERFVHATSAAPLPPVYVGYLVEEDRGLGSALALAASDVAGRPARPVPVPVGTTGLRSLGDLAAVERVLHDEAVDRVLFFPPLNHPAAVAEALRACETLGVPAGFHVDLAQPFESVPRVVQIYDQPFIGFELSPKPAEALALKHAIDALVAALAVLVLAPVLVVVAVAILVTMGRPLLFAQERAGLHGRTFRMWKFRTMVRDAEASRDALAVRNEMSGPVFKLASDPRVTRLGRMLRRTSIDELPQLFNVLAGSMSLVGPRPLPVKEQQQIRGWHRRRLSMKPGISGLWQVSGRNEVDFEQWMRLDLKYVDEWSLWLDVVLLLRTVPAVLSGRGAR